MMRGVSFFYVHGHGSTGMDEVRANVNFRVAEDGEATTGFASQAKVVYGLIASQELN
jgi:hypothetical protein